MDLDKPHLEHLKNDQNLITTHEETQAGYYSLINERNRKAARYLEEARALRFTASKAYNAPDLLNLREMQSALLMADGVSGNALNYLDKNELVKRYLKPADKAFVDDLVFRFLLARGDALACSMRNVDGELARRKLIRSFISILNLADCSYKWLDSRGNWIGKKKDDSDIELYLRGLS
jgi:hypothetical protein